MVTQSGPPSGYTRSVITYLPNTPAAEQWGAANEALIERYILGFTSSVTILSQITDDFVHADGGGTCAMGELTLSPFFVGHGARTFANAFRDEIVAAVAIQTGVVPGTYLTRSAGRKVLDLVLAKLREHGETLRGELVGAAMVEFPGELRIGGEALDMPPFLMGPPVNAQGFTRIEADPDRPKMNRHKIRVIQLWLATAAEPDDPEGPDTRLFTARVGIQLAGTISTSEGSFQLGYEPTVPGAIAEEIRNLRDGTPYHYAPHDVTAQWLIDWAGRQPS